MAWASPPPPLTTIALENAHVFLILLTRLSRFAPPHRMSRSTNRGSTPSAGKEGERERQGIGRKMSMPKHPAEAPRWTLGGCGELCTHFLAIGMLAYKARKAGYSWDTRYSTRSPTAASSYRRLALVEHFRAARFPTALYRAAADLRTARVPPYAT